MASDGVESNSLRLLHRLEDPRVSIYLFLLKHNVLSKDAIMREGRLSPDKTKRALDWLLKEGFVKRLYVLENGKRIAAYHIAGVNRFLSLQLADTRAETAQRYV